VLLVRFVHMPPEAEPELAPLAAPPSSP
jgi:hypothetical protein